MPHREDIVRLRHMLDSAREAVSYVTGRTREDLTTDRMLVHALVRCVEIIGEAASKVSDDCRLQHPQIPWGGIIGMRNRLIHAYFDINLDILWRTVIDELPVLISQLEPLPLESQ